MFDHPGGEELLLQYCANGQDIADVLADPLLHSHSPAAMDILAGYYVGDLINEDSNEEDNKKKEEDEQGAGLKNRGKVVSSSTTASTTYSSTASSAKKVIGKPSDRFIDITKPMLYQVWSLGFSKEFYLEQGKNIRVYMCCPSFSHGSTDNSQLWYRILSALDGV